MRCARGRTYLLPLAVALGACQGSGTVGVELSAAEAWRVDLVLQEGSLLVTGVAAAVPQAGRTLFFGPTLSWELLDATGSPLAEGRIRDSRLAHTEWSVAGQMQRRDVRTEVGVVSIHLPPRHGDLVLYEDLPDGRRELGRLAVDRALTTGRLQQPLLDADEDVLGEPVAVVQNATRETALDILLLPEGFTEDELDLFHGFVEFLVVGMREVPSMEANWDRINIWRQDVRSRESGIDDPLADTWVDTAFDVSFGSSVRRCVFPKTSEARARLVLLGAAAQADQVILIANNGEEGACANSKLIAQTRTASAADVGVHELGHSIFELRDEYDYGNCNPEREGKNVSASPELADLPWSDLVNTDELPTPITTPWMQPIGAFEGAGYCAEGMYRPQHTCRMRTNIDPFCAVCAREVERYFTALPERVCMGEGCEPPEEPCPESLRDDGSCDECLGDDPDCAPSPPDPCPESLRGDGYCDTCLAHDADCRYCPVEWWEDGYCDECLRGDPDCGAAPIPP